MPDKKTYRWSFQLSEKTWSIGGMPCHDYVDESNYEAWNRYLSKQISKLLSADTMRTEEFQEELEAVRKNEEERLAHQEKQDEAAEVRRQTTKVYGTPEDRLCSQGFAHRSGESIR